MPPIPIGNHLPCWCFCFFQCFPQFPAKLSICIYQLPIQVVQATSISQDRLDPVNNSTPRRIWRRQKKKSFCKLRRKLLGSRHVRIKPGVPVPLVLVQQPSLVVDADEKSSHIRPRQRRKRSVNPSKHPKDAAPNDVVAVASILLVCKAGGTMQKLARQALTNGKDSKQKSSFVAWRV